VSASEVLLALVRFAPEVAKIVAEFWGKNPKLGPIPRSLKARAAAIDAEIDRKRAALR
jgi:hypothetical protein